VIALRKMIAILKRIGNFLFMVLTVGKSGKRAVWAWTYLFTGKKE